MYIYIYIYIYIYVGLTRCVFLSESQFKFFCGHIPSLFCTLLQSVNLIIKTANL